MEDTKEEVGRLIQEIRSIKRSLEKLKPENLDKLIAFNKKALLFIFIFLTSFFSIFIYVLVLDYIPVNYNIFVALDIKKNPVDLTIKFAPNHPEDLSNKIDVLSSDVNNVSADIKNIDKTIKSNVKTINENVSDMKEIIKSNEPEKSCLEKITIHKYTSKRGSYIKLSNQDFQKIDRYSTDKFSHFQILDNAPCNKNSNNEYLKNIIVKNYKDKKGQFIKIFTKDYKLIDKYSKDGFYHFQVR